MGTGWWVLWCGSCRARRYTSETFASRRIHCHLTGAQQPDAATTAAAATRGARFGLERPESAGTVGPFRANGRTVPGAQRAVPRAARRRRSRRQERGSRRRHRGRITTHLGGPVTGGSQRSGEGKDVGLCNRPVVTPPASADVAADADDRAKA